MVEIIVMILVAVLAFLLGYAGMMLFDSIKGE